jgi:tetratricopeptide (TPR) repeat protein
MNGFPGMGNFDPTKMDPAQMKQMLNLFSGMSDDQIKNTMKMMGIDMDPAIIRQFVDKLKNADDATLNQFKEQYSKGKVNMNSFSKHAKSQQKVKDAKKLIDDNKLNEAIELCEKEIQELKGLKIDEQKEKDEVNKILVELYDMKTLARYTTQDLDLCVKECQEANENNPSFKVYNRLGTCFFKKGRHVKARDAFMKAKELFPNEKDEIAEKYLKMALEEIENY